MEDLIPNFCYNIFTQRFVRAPVALKPCEYPPPPKLKRYPSSFGFGSMCRVAYEKYCKLTTGFFGKEHMEALLLLSNGYFDLSFLLEECMNVFTYQLMELQQYMETMRDAVPPCKLPKPMYRAEGCFGFFEGKLKSLLDYDDLKKIVFQSFREIGNALAFFKDLTEVLGVSESFRFMAVGPYLGISPDSVILPHEGTTASGISSHSSISKKVIEKRADRNGVIPIEMEVGSFFYFRSLSIQNAPFCRSY